MTYTPGEYGILRKIKVALTSICRLNNVSNAMNPGAPKLQSHQIAIWVYTIVKIFGGILIN